MESEFKEEVLSSEIVPDNHKKYAEYAVLEFIPNLVDGLKIVYRRLLWTLGTNTTKRKASKLIADTMGEFHPHGEQSINSGLLRLAQPFEQCLPLIEPLGNVGSVGGARAAAPRYLDITRSEFACDLFFNRTNNKTLTYVPNELGDGYEPAFLIPVIPTALIMGGLGIGCGFKSQIPFYDFVNVCDLTIRYIQLRKNPHFHPRNHYQELAKYFVPDFPVYSLVRNMAEITQLAARGDFSKPIVMDGCMDVYPDKVHIRSIPYGKEFMRVQERLQEEMAKPSFLSAHVNEFANLMAATDIGDIKISFKRGVDVFEILDELKAQLWFTRGYFPILNYSEYKDKQATVHELDPYQLIEKWFVERYRSVLGDLKFTQKDLNDRYREIEAKVIIVDHTDDVTNIVKTSADDDEAISRLVERFRAEKLSMLQARYILSLNLSQLTRQGKDKLLADLASIRVQLQEHTEKFNHVDEIIIKDIERVRDRYKSRIPYRCIIPDYIGCIHIHPNGIIQVRSIQELIHQVHRWQNTNLEIEMYPTGKSSHMKVIDGKAVPETNLCYPKAFKAHDFLTFKLKPKYTIVLNGGQICRTDGMGVPPKGQYIFCSDEFTGITKKDQIVRIKATDIPKRANAGAFGVQTDLVFISPVVDDDMVVLYYDVKQTNVVNMQRVKVGDKLKISVLSKTMPFMIVREQDPIAFTVSPDKLYHCNVKHLLFKDASTIMGDKRAVTLYLSKRSTSNDKTLVQIIKGDDVYGVQTLKKIPNTYEFL